MPSIALVILNWNGIDDTLACLASLRQQSYRDFHTVIVDNASHRDSSVEQLKKLPTDTLTVIYNDTNRGFSGGVNTGISWAIEHNYDYVALLNNDTTIEATWLENLINTATTYHAGITTSLILHEDGKTIDSTGDFYSIWGIPSPRLRNQSSNAIPSSEFVFGASGGASLYSVDMLKKIGQFDEDFFAYYEDIDVSFRAQLAGYKVYYESKAIVYHKQGATSSKIPGFTVQQAFKNLPLLFIKNIPRGLLLPIGVRFYFLYTLMIINAIRRGDGRPALKGVYRGIVLFWKSALWKRFAIQKQKTVSTDYIRSMISSELPPESSLRKLPWIKSRA